ncbi:MAG: twin-arginine translocation signal domain-containing protein, partial [Verrucomicrobiia bacterium]
MKPQQRITRRKFLGATAATAGGMMIAANRKLNAATDEFPSNDHFWYRAQPAGPYIDSQCDNRAFGHGDGQVMLSEDNGRTWPHRIAFPEEKHITFSHILKNGNVLFS